VYAGLQKLILDDERARRGGRCQRTGFYFCNIPYTTQDGIRGRQQVDIGPAFRDTEARIRSNPSRGTFVRLRDAQE